MTTEIDLAGEKQLLFMNSSFLNKGKVEFLQIKEDTIRQKCCQKHGKVLCNCVRIHEV